MRRASLALAAFLAVAVGVLAPSATAAPPVVIAEAVSEVGYTTMRAHGRVDPEGEETFYHFEYITDSLFDQNQFGGKAPFLGASPDGFGRLDATMGETAVEPVLGEFAGLVSGTEYHLRLVAESEGGSQIVVAPDFTTLTLPSPLPCFGDSCQVLPPEPTDPPLGTSVPGLGNPKVRYFHHGSKAKGPRKKKHTHKHHGRGRKGKKQGTKGSAG